MIRLFLFTFLALCGLSVVTHYVFRAGMDNVSSVARGPKSAGSANSPCTANLMQAGFGSDVTLLKRMLPRKCGPGVTWFDIEARDNEIIYKYRLELDRDVIESHRLAMRMPLSQQGALFSRLIGKDVRIRLEIYDRHGEFVFSESLGGEPVASPASALADTAQQANNVTSEHLEAPGII